MFRYFAQLLTLIAFSFAFAMPASAVSVISNVATCAEMAPVDAPVSPCCDLTCTASMGQCALCAPIIATEKTQYLGMTGLALRLAARNCGRISNFAAPPEPPPPRDMIV